MWVCMCIGDTGQGDPVLKSVAGETKVELPRSEADLAGYLLNVLNMIKCP